MQKPVGKEDVRVQRTRKLLQQALIDVTVEMGFAAVTVRDICERAMVNRSTFYRYYLSYAGVGAFLWWLEHDQPCSVAPVFVWLVRYAELTG